MNIQIGIETKDIVPVGKVKQTIGLKEVRRQTGNRGGFRIDGTQEPFVILLENGYEDISGRVR